jgi:hypothetical protein
VLIVCFKLRALRPVTNATVEHLRALVFPPLAEIQATRYAGGRCPVFLALK